MARDQSRGLLGQEAIVGAKSGHALVEVLVDDPPPHENNVPWVLEVDL